MSDSFGEKKVHFEFVYSEPWATPEIKWLDNTKYKVEVNINEAPTVC